MTRLDKRLANLSDAGEKALGIFVTAGYPSLGATAEILACLDHAGVDFIELGMPFSDPLAEGKTIQATSAAAIDNGADLDFVLSVTRRFRRNSDTPVVLMGYVNPIYKYGYGNFCSAAASSGVDGLIIADLPVHESDPLRKEAKKAGLNVIHLITPNTISKRVRHVDECSSGFVYAVSLIGLTGADITGKSAVTDYLNRVRSLVQKNKLMAGFGIQTREHAEHLAESADGVIVGTAFLKGVAERWDELDSQAEKQAAVDTFLSQIRPRHGTAGSIER